MEVLRGSRGKPITNTFTILPPRRKTMNSSTKINEVACQAAHLEVLDEQPGVTATSQFCPQFLW
jgi:hypothetical protein